MFTFKQPSFGFCRLALIVAAFAITPILRADVYLSQYNFSVYERPSVYTDETLPLPYKLRVKIIGVPGYPDGFHAVNGWNNNYETLQGLPPAGTYQAKLYWVKYASDYSTLLEVGPQTTVYLTVNDGVTYGSAPNSNSVKSFWLDVTGDQVPDEIISADDYRVGLSLEVEDDGWDADILSGWSLGTTYSDGFWFPSFSWNLLGLYVSLY